LVSTLFGLGGGIAMPALMAMAVIKGKQTESMGSVIALLTMGHSIGMLVGALGAGLMMDWLDLRGAFFLGALLMFAGVAVFFVCRKDGADADGGAQRFVEPPV
jgi:MFS transporter, DHA1 family, multidrug resistance protein